MRCRVFATIWTKWPLCRSSSSRQRSLFLFNIAIHMRVEFNSSKMIKIDIFHVGTSMPSNTTPVITCFQLLQVNPEQKLRELSLSQTMAGITISVTSEPGPASWPGLSGSKESGHDEGPTLERRVTTPNSLPLRSADHAKDVTSNELLIKGAPIKKRPNYLLVRPTYLLSSPR